MQLFFILKDLSDFLPQESNVTLDKNAAIFILKDLSDFVQQESNVTLDKNAAIFYLKRFIRFSTRVKCYS